MALARSCVLILLCSSLLTSTASSEIPRAADAPQPLSPAESQQRFQLPEDLQIELVASEPLLADPSAIMIDSRGRFFVCELHGYNLEGHLDIVELNKTGELDREVRRVFVKGDLLQRARLARTGSVKRLIDLDGDGRMDSADTWADDLPPCYGMVPYRAGLIVICAPDIVYLEDRDEDGTAEVRQTLFSGFDVDVMERAINNPQWGLDDWIYVAAGGTAPTVNGPNLAAPVDLGRTDFRFKPDGSAIEAISGTNGTFGHALTDYGDRFLISTSTPAYFVVPLPRRYLLRNPFAPSPSESNRAANYNRIYPTSQPHPWRATRGADPNWVKFYGSGEATPNGFFTSGCSPLVYRATNLPRRFTSNYFCCDPSNNLVHRAVVRREGASLSIARAAEETARDFLTSTDQWFRPMNLYLGPDGAIYVVDFYREIIEDYSAIPRFLQQQYGLIEGEDRGRIWRITRKTENQRRWPDGDQPSDRELVAWISDDNAWWRQTAQRLLVERRASNTAAALRDVVKQGSLPAGRVQALYALRALGSLETATLRQSLRDKHYQVRRHALRLVEPSLRSDTSLLANVAAMTNDDDPLVRLQLALTLGATRAPEALDALAELVIHYGHERWMDAAIVSSVVERVPALVERLVQSGQLTDGCRACLPPLAACVGSMRQTAALDRLLATVASWEGPTASNGRLLLLTGLSQTLDKQSGDDIELTTGNTALKTLLQSTDPRIVRLTLTIAGHTGLKDAPLLNQAFENAVRNALDVEKSPDVRLANLEFLKSAAWATRAKLIELVETSQPPAIQLAAVTAIANGDDESVAQLLLARWQGLSPQVQQGITDALFARPARIPALVTAMEQGQVSPNSVSSLRRAQILEHSDATLRARAAKLFTNTSTEARRAIVERFHAALQLERDPVRGLQVFQSNCSKCHRLQEYGFAVGPDLTAAKGRPDEALLNDLFDPSSDIKPGYSVATAVTHDGRSFTGVLAEEAATSVKLVREKGVEDTILRREIEELQISSKSMMPDGLEKEMTPQDVADLLGFLRQTLGPPQPSTTVLFDEERAIVDALTDGEGTVEVWSEDCASGQLSLKVTPPQRYRAQIMEWGFPVVEDPQPGEYRYLRLTWKAPAAEGVMLEIAASGSWPPADSPSRRYFAGQNTTEWQAQQVSTQVPREWTTVTVDLFQDCGAFTLTGLAPTAMGGPAYFDRILLMRSIDESAPLSIQSSDSK